jgi:hypothetical protein
MEKPNLNNVGIQFGDKMPLRTFVDQIEADFNEVKRLAKRSGLLINVGGAYFINAAKFLTAQETIQEMRAEKRKSRKDGAGTGEASVENTERESLLRGQKTRLTNLVNKYQARIAELAKSVKTEKDRTRKSQMETESGVLQGRIENIQETLKKVEKRLAELANLSDSDTQTSV